MSPLVAQVLCLLSLATLAHAVVYGWGSNDQAQLGMGTMTPTYLPSPIQYYNSIPLFDIHCAPNYHIALASNGSAYGSGLQYYGQFALGYTSQTAIKTPIPCPALNSSLTMVLSGAACNANMNTNLLGWGNVAGYVQGKQSGTFPKIQTALASYKFDGKVVSVNSVMEGVLVRLANNTVWVAGTNGNGRLGIGNQNTQYTFVEATFWRTVPLRKIFSSQSQHVCGLAVNNSLYCWGQNSYGQLGVGDTSPRYTPTRVSFFDDNNLYVYKVSYGDLFTMVLTCGGRLFGFGTNSRGQMGQGQPNSQNYTTPIEVTFGQLGNGIPDSSNHTTPTQIFVNNGNTGNEQIVELVTGYSQAMVRTSSNNWYVWGGGTTGALGMVDSMGKASDVYSPTYNPAFSSLNINRIKSSSQSNNFFGWNDPTVTNELVGCPTLQNECLDGTAQCDRKAYCTDLERGYMCTCRVGWTGDGTSNGTGCYNPNSCDVTGNSCISDSFCDDSSGYAQCVCPLGSQGDGKIDGTGCTDIDECLGYPCAGNAYCTNLSPNYNCTCNPGYTGDPYISGCTILCPPGQYATNLTNCELCPPGTYTDVPAAQNCFPCPAGFYNNQYGASSVEDCQQCPVGGYSEPKATYCSLCVHGYTNDPTFIHSDNSTCTECPLGSYGYYGQCYSCGQGQFSSDAVAKGCHNCPPGYINTNSASTSCTPCPAGTSSRGGSSTCIDCPAGYYSPSASKDCLKCPLGTSTNGLVGQTSCTNCTAGSYNNKLAAQVCAPCAAGTYSTAPGTASCTRCAPGTIAASSGATSCTLCASGTYTTGSGSTQCSACESGFVTIDGTSCEPCLAGFYYDSASRTCKMCAAGTFVAVSGSTSCYSCAPGTYASGRGSTFCARCGVNTYSSASTGFVNCTACPAGTKSPGGAYVCS